MNLQDHLSNGGRTPLLPDSTLFDMGYQVPGDLLDFQHVWDLDAR